MHWNVLSRVYRCFDRIIDCRYSLLLGVAEKVFSLEHITGQSDTVTQFVTICDSVWHYVTLCDSAWLYLTRYHHGWRKWKVGRWRNRGAEVERRAAVSRWMRRVSTPSIFLSFVISIFPNFYSLIFLKILALTHTGCKECPHLQYFFLSLFLFFPDFYSSIFLKILSLTHAGCEECPHLQYFFLSLFPYFL